MNALSDGWPTWSIGWVHRAGEKAVAPGFYSSAGSRISKLTLEHIRVHCKFYIIYNSKK